MNILVIKLGALGDFILAEPAYAAIRAHHPDARITLLTTQPFAAIAAAAPFFDEVWIDEKPTLGQPLKLLRLRRRLREGAFTRIYDLQTSDRTGLYYRLLWPGKKPEWSGIAKGCSHPDPTPDRAAVHSFDLRIAQLRAAGFDAMPAPDFTWMKGDAARFGLPGKTILLVPGSAPHRPEKRWPVEKFATLAARLAGKGYTPVVLGDAKESDLGRGIAGASPRIVDLTSKTSLFDIADLARGAVAAIGNDTGPMHLIAAAGCPSLVLFSAASDPAHSSPRGKSVSVLRRDDLAALDINEVYDAISLAT